MKIKIREIQPETLTRFMFRAPKWWQSLLIIFAIGAIIDLICYAANIGIGLGFAFSIPAAFAILTTNPLVKILGRQEFTWNRSALLALAGEIFAIFWLLTAPLLGVAFA